ncbi:hypothetical protein FPCIR_5341 [Fusarium pseudocircinatum]|uniref:Uncharacterized protein n=1 Tax=Fusarium pseudocircinatum TaxID=56676 RepID=A0A8H5PAV7_9HYPO|nr:hypothetical protein FPCIR_5341 [Fusarium pseudocircinatum]
MTQETTGDIGQAGQNDPGLPPADPVQVDHANMAPKIEEEPDSLPLPVLGTRLEDFEADGDYLTSRPSGRFLSSQTHLGLWEKLDLADNMRKWVKTEELDLYHGVSSDVINISAEDRASFFNEVYKDWSSAADVENMPSKPREREKDDTRILIGKWSQDLPASKNKRKREEDGESPTKMCKRDKVRRQNQPAFFGVGISSGKGEEKVIFDVKYDSNQIAAAQYVEWDTNDNSEDLKRRVLTRWDRTERARIREFNQRRILISSRNYIIRAAKAGFAEGARPPVAPPELVVLSPRGRGITSLEMKDWRWAFSDYQQTNECRIGATIRCMFLMRPLDGYLSVIIDLVLSRNGNAASGPEFESITRKHPYMCIVFDCGQISIVRGLEKFDSESQVQRFNNTPEFCPSQRGWLYPLIPHSRDVGIKKWLF